MNTVEKLIKKYAEIFSNIQNRPKWAVKKSGSEELVHPSIPFVGKSYDETKILLYASAENLKDYSGWIDDDKKAINRHRIWFAEHSENKFFPNVHIKPMNNGGLVNVIGYVAMKTFPDFRFSTPYELLEGVSFANFGKFSIEVNEGGTNIDQAGDYCKLEKSLEYIKADLDILKPELLIMPYTIYEHSLIREIFENQYSGIKVITIYQLHHFNINGNDRLKKFEKKDKTKIGILADWQDHFGKGLTGKTNDNFFSFYTYLDKQMLKTELFA